VKTCAGVLVVAIALTGSRADTSFPSAEGTTWNYQMTQEFGEGVSPGAEEKTTVGQDGKVHLPITMFINGTVKIDGVETLKYELHRARRGGRYARETPPTAKSSEFPAAHG